MSYLPLNSVRNITNAAAKSGGLAFDGVTASSKDIHTIGSDIGTSYSSISSTFLVPTASGVNYGIVTLTPSNTTGNIAYAFYAIINSSGALEIVLFGSSTGNYRIATLSGLITSYGGKVINLTITKDTAITVYINGISQTLTTNTFVGSDPGWTSQVLSTYCFVGAYTSSVLFSGPIFSATLFNRALLASEVITLANQGVQESDKWGSLTAVYGPQSFAGGVDSWTADFGAVSAPTTVGGQTSIQAIASGGATQLRMARTIPGLVAGKKYRVSFDLYVPSQGNDTQVALINNGTGNATLAYHAPVAATWTPYNTEVTLPASPSGIKFALYTSGFSGTITTGSSFAIKNLSVTPIGSILDADLSAGVGYQVPDRSSNSYHGLISTSGTSWTLPIKNQKAIFTTSSSGYLGDATNRVVIPSNARINSITAYSASGSTFSLGDDSAASTNLVSSVAISAATLTDLTLLKRYATTSTAGRIYVAFSVANSTTFTIDYSITATS